MEKQKYRDVERYVFGFDASVHGTKYKIFSGLKNNREDFSNKFKKSIADIEKVHDRLKEDFNDDSPFGYIILFQVLGFRIRKKIDIFIGKKKVTTGIHYIPEVINRIIKIYRFISEGPTRIVVESIRNSHEIDFF